MPGAGPPPRPPPPQRGSLASSLHPRQSTLPCLPRRSFRARGSRLLVLRGKPAEVLLRAFKVSWEGGGGARQASQPLQTPHRHGARLVRHPPPAAANAAGLGRHPPLLRVRHRALCQGAVRAFTCCCWRWYVMRRWTGAAGSYCTAPSAFSLTARAASRSPPSAHAYPQPSCCLVVHIPSPSPAPLPHTPRPDSVG